MSDGNENHYKPTMRFVTCKSEGGPHDDHAYAQGWSMCALDVLLPTVVETHEQYLHPSSLPQADLLAMRHGFTMTSEPWDEHPDEWTRMTFTRLPHAD